MLRVKQKERGREQFNPRKRNIADHSGALGTLSFSTSSGEGLLLQKIPWEPLRFSSHPDPCPTFANFYHPAFVSFCFFPLSFHFLLLLHLKGPTGKIQSSPVLGQQKRECPTIGDAPPSLHPTHSRHYGFLRVPVLQWSPQSHNDKTSGVSQRLGVPPTPPGRAFCIPDIQLCSYWICCSAGLVTRGKHRITWAKRKVLCFMLKSTNITLLIQKGNVLRENSKCSWSKPQGELMGRNEDSFRMKTDVILHKAGGGGWEGFAASKYLDKELHEGKVQIVSVLENKAGGKRQLESCWVTGALEEGAHRASRRRLPRRLSFHLMIGRQMAKEAALEGQLRCLLILMQKFWRLRHTSCLFLA